VGIDPTVPGAPCDQRIAQQIGKSTVGARAVFGNRRCRACVEHYFAPRGHDGHKQIGQHADVFTPKTKLHATRPPVAKQGNYIEIPAVVIRENIF
jgi:hypothetical protein